MADLATLLRDALWHMDLLQLIKYAGVASITYIVLDVVETFSDEVDLVWPSRLSGMKIIFYINRYLPVFDVSLGVYILLWVRQPKLCAVLWDILVVLYPGGSFVSEVILMVRTVALWNFNRIVLGIMVLNGVIIVVPTASLVPVYIQGLHYPSEDVLEITRCVPSISDSIGWVFYMSVIISETTVVSLTILKHHMTRGRDGALPLLLRTLYRDGMGFYCLMLGISVANLLCMLVAPVEISSALQLPHRAIHSTLCSRVLLNLRKAAARSSGHSIQDFTVRSGLVFEQAPDEELSYPTYCDSAEAESYELSST
ncbi:hypothetical protein BD413DRAFT_185303 [Trametes elegans]|nr:hypothetical protein BD413DRAFT_185303 [Trametes elegans]